MDSIKTRYNYITNKNISLKNRKAMAMTLNSIA